MYDMYAKSNYIIGSHQYLRNSWETTLMCDRAMRHFKTTQKQNPNDVVIRFMQEVIETAEDARTGHFSKHPRTVFVEQPLQIGNQ